MNNLKKELRALKHETESELKRAVITDILSQGDNKEIQCYIKDTLQYGCISGNVTGLIYYTDTEKFFKKHITEIFELYNELKEETGGDLLKELNSNNLAWFGYEQTLQNIAIELNIEF